MHENDVLKYYRPNVGVVLFNTQGQVFLGQRYMDPQDLEHLGFDDQLWQFPQGGIDKGEEPQTAAFRELQEETGVTSARLICMTPHWIFYNFPKGYKKKDWKGQRQKWAAMLFEGDDSEIDLMADDHQEFGDWRWADLEETPPLIVPFKRPIYEEIVEAFTPMRDFIRDNYNR